MELRIGVTAVGSGIGHAVVQSCRMARRQPYLVGFDASPTAFDGFECDESHLVPRTSDPSYVEALAALCAGRRVRLLIPGLDADVSVLSRVAERFAGSGTTVLVGGPEFVGLCRDKIAWSRELHPICPAIVPAWSPDEAQVILREGGIRFPLVAKPAAGSGSVGVRVVADAGELASIPSGYVLQPFAAPAANDPSSAAVRAAARRGEILQVAEISYQLLVSRAGRILGRVATRNVLKNGVPVEMIPVDDEPYWRALRPAVEHLIPRGLRGPVNFQGRLTDDGPRFFEMNGRFTGITAFRAMIGFNEVDAAVADFLELGPASPPSLSANRSRVGIRQVIDRAADLRELRELQTHVTRQTGSAPGREPLAIVITGAAGFLGRHLVRALLADPTVGKVVAVVRDLRARELWPAEERLHVLCADESTSLVSALAGADLLYHLAFARSGVPEQLAASLRFTRDLVSAARRVHLPRFVFASSQAVYGTARPGPYAETLGPAPETPYATAKVAGEELTTLVREGSPRSRVTSLRLSRLYGAAAGLRWSELPHLFASRAVSGEPIEIRGGDQRFDLLHVRDAVGALVRLAGSAPAQWAPVYNVGAGAPVTVLEIGRASLSAARRLGRTPGELRIDPGAGGSARGFGLDARRFEAETGWSPRVTLGEAMDELAALAIEAGRRSSGGAHSFASEE